jgi:hypothetical protein
MILWKQRTERVDMDGARTVRTIGYSKHETGEIVLEVAQVAAGPFPGDGDGSVADEDRVAAFAGECAAGVAAVFWDRKAGKAATFEIGRTGDTKVVMTGNMRVEHISPDASRRDAGGWARCEGTTEMAGALRSADAFVVGTDEFWTAICPDAVKKAVNEARGLDSAAAALLASAGHGDPCVSFLCIRRAA